MPRLSYFYGISVYLYSRDHNPPHIHAIYAGEEVIVEIQDMSVIKGTVPPRAMRMLRTWMELHRQELLGAWASASEGQVVGTIEPLP
ncbi:MAG: DUF4160 domain-containing protein [Actinomycetota bacterium]|nr:DUF4160 domain-containing protein [Actinomycetota bacterium]